MLDLFIYQFVIIYFNISPPRPISLFIYFLHLFFSQLFNQPPDDNTTEVCESKSLSLCLETRKRIQDAVFSAQVIKPLETRVAPSTRCVDLKLKSRYCETLAIRGQGNRPGHVLPHTYPHIQVNFTNDPAAIVQVQAQLVQTESLLQKVAQIVLQEVPTGPFLY